MERTQSGESNANGILYFLQGNAFNLIRVSTSTGIGTYSYIFPFDIYRFEINFYGFPISDPTLTINYQNLHILQL